MNADLASHQRIGRLTPLADVLAAIGEIEPVAPKDIAIASAQGRVLASDIVATKALPAAPVALRDGWAVDADATRDAAGYAPVTLQPQPVRVDAFVPLPPGTDAVATADTVAAVGRTLQVTAPVTPGEGVLLVSGDVEAGARLAAAGARLRAIDAAALTAAGVASARVRAPKLRIVNTRPGDPVLDAATDLVARAAVASGAQTEMCTALDRALRADGADATIAIGGTGAGDDDRSVVALARAGTVICHGIGLSPGETSAFGTSNGRPVLLMPGRLDAVLACWLVLGEPLLARLAGAQIVQASERATLTRKVASAIGFAEVVLLARSGGAAEPLASSYLSLQAMARADGWMLVPAGSEGYPPGTDIDMRPLP